jgi:Xaa-Pro aminopeptidase
MREESRRRGLDALVIYGDREHFANLWFACGHDPRFEEAVLVIPVDDEPAITVGNEGIDYLTVSPAGVRPVLCQSLSLMGQDRTKQSSLVEALCEAGVRSGARLGVIGWKTFDRPEGTGGLYLAVPAFVVAALQGAIGSSGEIVDATAVLVDPIEGLRVTADAATIAQLEYGAALASEHVWKVIDGFEVGMTELEAGALLGLNGYPQICHTMVTSGRGDFVGLRSPSGRVIEQGDVLSVAVGLWGGLTARAGMVASDEDELDDPQRGFDAFAATYFGAIRAWYRAVRVGASGADVVAAVDSALAGAFGLVLNPGHSTHFEEWLHSPMVATETRALRSGMVLQCDLIPASDPARFFCNCEDTLCLADSSLRAEIASSYPGLMARIRARRRLLAEVLGEEPAEEILPLTNTPAYFRPLLLRRGEVLAFS